MFEPKNDEFIGDENINNRCFTMSISENAGNLGKKILFVSGKNGQIIQILTGYEMSYEAANRLVQEKKGEVKIVNELTGTMLLKLIKLGFQDRVDDLVYRGIRFQKSGLYYRIVDYSPQDKVGILRREIDNKLLIIINFPKFGKLLWNVKGEYSVDQVGINKYLQEREAILHSQDMVE